MLSMFKVNNKDTSYKEEVKNNLKSFFSAFPQIWLEAVGGISKLFLNFPEDLL